VVVLLDYVALNGDIVELVLISVGMDVKQDHVLLPLSNAQPPNCALVANAAHNITIVEPLQITVELDVSLNAQDQQEPLPHQVLLLDLKILALP